MATERKQPEPGLLTTGEAARILGSSRQHVVDMCTRAELPFIWVGRHRRVRRSDLARLLQDEQPALTRDQERSLWLHRALAGHLMEQPEQVMNLAKRNTIRLLEQHHTGMTTHWLTEWQRLLDTGVDEVADTLTSRDPHAVELRQNSPFAGALPQDTRSRVLAAFLQHWRNDHSPSEQEFVDA